MVPLVLFGIILLASNRLSANAGSLYHALSRPGLFSGMATLDMGPFSFLVFWRCIHSGYHVQVIFAVLIIAVFDMVWSGLMLRIFLLLVGGFFGECSGI